MLCIKYIAFACYPPMSDTSQDRGLVDMFESQEVHVLFSQYWFIVMLKLLLMFSTKRSRSCS